MQKRNSTISYFRSIVASAIAFVLLVAVVFGEQIIWEIPPLSDPPIPVIDREMFGLGPGNSGQYFLARLQLDSNTNKNVGRPGVINDITAIFEGPAIPFDSFPAARFNQDTGFFEIDGLARLNILPPDGTTPSNKANPFDGSRVQATFIHDTVNDQVIVRATNLVRQLLESPSINVSLEDLVLDVDAVQLVDCFVGLTPIIPVVKNGELLFEGLHLANDFPVAREEFSASRIVNGGPPTDPWIQEDSFANLTIRGSSLPELQFDDDDKIYLSFVGCLPNESNCNEFGAGGAQLGLVENRIVGEQGFINIWIQESVLIDGSATFDISTSQGGVIQFTDSEVFNPEVVGLGTRWGITDPGTLSPNGQSLTGVFAGTDAASVGIGFPGSDTLFDSAFLTESYLFGRIRFEVIGSGSTRINFSSAAILDSSMSTFTLNDVTLNSQTVSEPFLLGDVNCDGALNLLDVAPFVDLIATTTFNAKGDINGDGTVNLLDVGPFVDLLAGG